MESNSLKIQKELQDLFVAQNEFHLFHAIEQFKVKEIKICELDDEYNINWKNSDKPFPPIKIERCKKLSIQFRERQLTDLSIDTTDGEYNLTFPQSSIKGNINIFGTGKITLSFSDGGMTGGQNKSLTINGPKHVSLNFGKQTTFPNIAISNISDNLVFAQLQNQNQNPSIRIEKLCINTVKTNSLKLNGSNINIENLHIDTIIARQVNLGLLGPATDRHQSYSIQKSSIETLLLFSIKKANIKLSDLVIAKKIHISSNSECRLDISNLTDQAIFKKKKLLTWRKDVIENEPDEFLIEGDYKYIRNYNCHFRSDAILKLNIRSEGIILKNNEFNSMIIQENNSGGGINGCSLFSSVKFRNKNRGITFHKFKFLHHVTFENMKFHANILSPVAFHQSIDFKRCIFHKIPDLYESNFPNNAQPSFTGCKFKDFTTDKSEAIYRELKYLSKQRQYDYGEQLFNSLELRARSMKLRYRRIERILSSVAWRINKLGDSLSRPIFLLIFFFFLTATLNYYFDFITIDYNHTKNLGWLSHNPTKDQLLSFKNAVIGSATSSFVFLKLFHFAQDINYSGINAFLVNLANTLICTVLMYLSIIGIKKRLRIK